MFYTRSPASCGIGAWNLYVERRNYALCLFDALKSGSFKRLGRKTKQRLTSMGVYYTILLQAIFYKTACNIGVLHIMRGLRRCSFLT